MAAVLLDFGQASEGIPDQTTLRIFAYAWIGYPVVVVLVAVARQTRLGTYIEEISIFKDFSYGLLDAFTKVMFAGYTAFSAFDRPGSTADPAVWPPPAAPSRA